MSVDWANHDDIVTSDTFETLHSGLIVQLIATPRQNLHTCRLDENAAAVIDGNTGKFDFLPVIRDETDEGIVGLFRATEFADGTGIAGQIRDHYTTLSEDTLIAADASILDFIKVADVSPCQLVLRGRGISGLVSLSDLQKLPVRAALFALITGFEMTMTAAIRDWNPSECDWLPLLSEDRRARIREEIAKSKQSDGFVDSLLFTQFCDKADIIRKSDKLSISKTALKDKLKYIQKLRDSLAHANAYAASPVEAKHVCRVVRDLLNLRDEIVGATRSGDGFSSAVGREDTVA